MLFSILLYVWKLLKNTYGNICVLYLYTKGKNDFAEVFENFAKYRFENVLNISVMFFPCIKEIFSIHTDFYS